MADAFTIFAALWIIGRGRRLSMEFINGNGNLKVIDRIKWNNHLTGPHWTVKSVVINWLVPISSLGLIGNDVVGWLIEFNSTISISDWNGNVLKWRRWESENFFRNLKFQIEKENKKMNWLKFCNVRPCGCVRMRRGMRRKSLVRVDTGPGNLTCRKAEAGC